MNKKDVIKHIKKDLYCLMKFLPFKKKKKFILTIYKNIKKLVKKDTSNVLLYHEIAKKIRNHFIYKTIVDEDFDDMSLTAKKLIKKCIEMQPLINDIQLNIDKMVGDYVIKMNSYEKDFCTLMNWECVNSRYYDCVTGNNYIELKKGKSMMWFDMVRYSEIFLGKGTQNTITLFIQYDKTKKRVNEIYIIPTVNIIKFLKIDKDTAEFAIKTYNNQTRGLNMQASMSKNDMKSIATHIIKRKE